MLYVFDFDGVLADTKELYIEFFTHAPFMNEKKARKLIERNAMKYEQKGPFQNFLKSYFLSDLQNHLKKDAQEYLFHDRIAELYHVVGKKVILSKNNPEFMKQMLGDHKEIFSDIYGTELSENKGEGLKLIAQKEGVEISDCLFFTDSISDVFEVSINFPDKNVFAVNWGFCNQKELENVIIPEQIISSFKRFIGQNQAQ